MKMKKLLVTSGIALATLTASYSYGYNVGNFKVDKLSSDVAALHHQVETKQTKMDKLMGELKTKEMIIEELSSGADFNQDFVTDSFVVTAYSPYDDVSGINSDGNPNSTATGTRPGPGTFAVDPEVIPYGSTIVVYYPDGTIERGRAEDTGGAINGNRLDVFRYTYSEAMKFGKQKAVVIWYEEENANG